MAIAFVNAAGLGNEAGSASTIVSPTQSVTGGNHLLVYIVWGDTTTTISSVADTAGNSYSSVGQIGASVFSITAYYAENVTGNASNQVTVTFSGAVTFRSIHVLQHSGLATSSSLDATGKTEQGSGSFVCTSPSFNTDTNDELLVWGVQIVNDTSSGWTAGGSYTIRSEDSDHLSVVEALIVSSTQTGATASITNDSSNTTMSGVLATFRGAGGGGGGRIFALAGDGGGLVGPSRGLVAAPTYREALRYGRAA